MSHHRLGKDARAPLPPDYILWLYRREMHLSWAELKAQPVWRTQQDLWYWSIQAESDAMDKA